jgi:hypothetical protein
MQGKSLANGHDALETMWDEQRRHKRKPVLWSARVESETGTAPCIILDLSLGGARLRVPPQAKANQPVTLVIDRFGAINAVVAWCHSGEMGLRFTDAPEQVANIIGGALPLANH